MSTLKNIGLSVLLAFVLPYLYIVISRAIETGPFWCYFVDTTRACTFSEFLFTGCIGLLVFLLTKWYLFLGLIVALFFLNKYVFFSAR